MTSGSSDVSQSVCWEIRHGDALDRLREMPPESVQCCITSPPYFGLRDYGTGEWAGGDAGCDHVQRMARGDGGRPATEVPRGAGGQMVPSGSSVPTETPLRYRDVCGKCGARRVDRQIGLEATPDEYVARLVGVFREVRRVLRADGTLWLNIGDSYSGAANSGGVTDRVRGAAPGHVPGEIVRLRGLPTKRGSGIKPKDLLGIPWLLAFALRADGWYLRSDIIWAKPNPMPESVTDRPTSAHEHVFLLAKSARYFYDADAIRENFADERMGNPGTYDRTTQQAKGANNDRADTGFLNNGSGWARGPELGGRNKRNVWEVATQPYAEAHFATFPPKLIEPCILAGSSPKACGTCGAPWTRQTERTPAAVLSSASEYGHGAGRNDGGRSMLVGATTTTTGWAPSCEHDDPTGRSIILDPFAGSGTTGVVALRHDRSFIGVELSAAYCEIARWRIRDDAPLLNTTTEAA